MVMIELESNKYTSISFGGLVLYFNIYLRFKKLKEYHNIISYNKYTFHYFFRNKSFPPKSSFQTNTNSHQILKLKVLKLTVNCLHLISFE